MSGNNQCSCSNTPPSTHFGDVATSGVQDVSAILPLLGTEQCERHIACAMERGYFYVAGTPVSIFGSLGIVKLVSQHFGLRLTSVNFTDHDSCEMQAFILPASSRS